MPLPNFFLTSTFLVAIQQRRRGELCTQLKRSNSHETLFYFNIILCINALDIKALRKLPVCPRLPPLPLLLILFLLINPLPASCIFELLLWSVGPSSPILRNRTPKNVIFFFSPQCLPRSKKNIPPRQPRIPS